MITDWLNAKVLEPIGISLPQGYVDLFLGNTAGCIGETSAFLLLAGTVYLLGKKVITWHVPVAYFGTFSLFVYTFGGLPFGGEFFTGDLLFHLFSGGLMLGVFYMATDMVTSPLTKPGMLMYGAGAGFLTFLIRQYGSFPEGVALAIILMDCFVPFINRCTASEALRDQEGGNDEKGRFQQSEARGHHGYGRPRPRPRQPVPPAGDRKAEGPGFPRHPRVPREGRDSGRGEAGEGRFPGESDLSC